MFYVFLKSGCSWRLLPREFPPWETVYCWFRKWTINGTFERLDAALREVVRSRSGRDPLPSAGIADSQTTKTPPGSAQSKEGTTETRRYAVESGTYSWTRRAWC